MQKNFKRMIALADEVFDVKHDPTQLDVNEKVIERLLQIHPSAVTELSNEDGPYCWILLIPTTSVLMNDFLQNKISESELFEQTAVGDSYDCVYLCSAMLLEEFRHRGIAQQTTAKAIQSIKQQHTISNLFVWSFTPEGNKAAEAIADILQLPLLKKMNA